MLLLPFPPGMVGRQLNKFVHDWEASIIAKRKRFPSAQNNISRTESALCWPPCAGGSVLSMHTSTHTIAGASASGCPPRTTNVCTASTVLSHPFSTIKPAHQYLMVMHVPDSGILDSLAPIFDGLSEMSSCTADVRLSLIFIHGDQDLHPMVSVS